MPRHPPRAFLRSIPNSNDSALFCRMSSSNPPCGASSHSMLDCFLSRFFAVISICRNRLAVAMRPGAPTGAKETRTPNIQLAKLALYQLSYNPSAMGLNGLEPLTPALSERCSNQLSYRPGLVKESEMYLRDGLGKQVLERMFQIYSLKEVIQPHLPVRLPCYDLAPVKGLALGACTT